MNTNHAKLRGKMRECGFTQEQLAAVIDMNKGTLSFKLNGRTAFTIDETLAICKALDIPTSEISAYFYAE